MRKFLLTAAILGATSTVSFAQTMPQDYTNIANPPLSASSNDRSKDPAGAIEGSVRQSYWHRSNSLAHEYGRYSQWDD